MTKVVSIDGSEIALPEPNAETENLFADLAIRSKSGEIVAGIVVYTKRDGSVGYLNTDQPQFVRALGMLYLLADEMMADWREGR
jgi:hypothetical protein